MKRRGFLKATAGAVAVGWAGKGLGEVRADASWPKPADMREYFEPGSPEILALVDQIAKAMLAATLRKAAAGAGEILSELHRQATKSGKVGDRRKAAELVLKHVAGDPSRPQVQVTQAQGVAVSLDGLSDETKATVLKELNGPCLTPEQPDEPPDGPSDASPCETGESA